MIKQLDTERKREERIGAQSLKKLKIKILKDIKSLRLLDLIKKLNPNQRPEKKEGEDKTTFLLRQLQYYLDLTKNKRNMTDPEKKKSIVVMARKWNRIMLKANKKGNIINWYKFKYYCTPNYAQDEEESKNIKDAI